MANIDLKQGEHLILAIALTANAAKLLESIKTKWTAFSIPCNPDIDGRGISELLDRAKFHFEASMRP